MITLNGVSVPNLPFLWRNLNKFEYPNKELNPDYTGTSVLYGPEMHSGSGTTDIAGSFSADLFTTDYIFSFGERNKEILYYKDLTSGSTGSSIDFGGHLNILSGTELIDRVLEAGTFYFNLG